MNLRPAFAALASVSLINALSWLLIGRLGIDNVLMLHLLPVLFCAFRYGRWSGILAAILAVFGFDFCFVPPYGSLTVHDSRYLLTFAIFLSLSLFISHVSSQLRRQARTAQRREARARELAALGQALCGAFSRDQIITASTRHLAAAFPEAEARLCLLEAQGGFSIHPPGADGLDPERIRRLLDQGGMEEDEGRLYLPLRAALRCRGVLVLLPRQNWSPSEETRSILATCGSQIALSLERDHFITVAHEVELGIEEERLRNSLLAAVSHDLRTPLTAIIGTASLLDKQLAGSPGAELSRLILDRSRSLHRNMENILELARFQDGKVTPHFQDLPVEEAFGSALFVLDEALQGRPVDFDLPCPGLCVRADPVMLERLLVNLIDNAIKYSPAGSAIGLAARRSGDLVEILVRDHGDGLPEGDVEALFTPFVRGDASRSGTGLGLSICRCICRVHRGHLDALPAEGGGSVFRLSLPAVAALEIPESP